MIYPILFCVPHTTSTLSDKGYGKVASLDIEYTKCTLFFLYLESLGEVSKTVLLFGMVLRWFLFKIVSDILDVHCYYCYADTSQNELKY